MSLLEVRVVYKITCPCCTACYVGQTIRHLLYRIREHRRPSTPVGANFRACNDKLTMSDVTIIASSLKTIFHLMTLEALCINEDFFYVLTQRTVFSFDLNPFYILNIAAYIGASLTELYNNSIILFI